MSLLTNIRAKVWSCVSIALIAYLFATIATSVSNDHITESLTEIEEIYYPLALKGEKAFTLFKEQTKRYAEGLITSDEDEINEANRLDETIFPLLNEMVHISSDHFTEFYPHLLDLRDKYEDYFSLASDHYFQAIQTSNPFIHAKELRKIAKLRKDLMADFQEKTSILTDTVVEEIGKTKYDARNNTLLLLILFLSVLFCITFFINLIANHQLIKPLSKIKDMIDSFARGKKITKPDICNDKDEICALALSFWNMKEELEKITFSKNYVDNIINNMSDCLIVVSPSLTITRVNQSTINLLDCAEEELNGLQIQEIFNHNSDAKKTSLQIFFDELLHGKSISNLESALKTKNNEHIPILLSGAPLYQQDSSVEGIVCLIRDISQFKKDAQLRELRVNYDHLTGLPNRNLLLDRLKQNIVEAKRYGQIVSVLLIDLDMFAAINETLGQESGDLILREVSRRIRQCLRETDTVGRVKADEFAVILNRLNDKKDSEGVAQKILDIMSQPLPVFGADTLGISIGISSFPFDGEEINDLLQKADLAMYEAKSRGGDQYVCFDKKMTFSED